ncbi:uncharacterized protein [Henckelia pumila]|uniref:uncharacterized protein isoform X2 n=1 Tax=Henckelia pumila TaxID=405737 RepID=UPI003C6E5644
MDGVKISVRLCDGSWFFLLMPTRSRGASFVRVNTVPPKILNSEKIEAPSGLERSKTEKHLPKAEKQRRNDILAEEAAQIFDDRISVQQKAFLCKHGKAYLFDKLWQ